MSSTGVKSLAKDTAIYGGTTIVVRSFNWLLTFFFVHIFTNPAEFGKVGQLYGYTALLLVLLTYGMETGFFRFMGKKEENVNTVYSTSLITLLFTSFVFCLFCFLLVDRIALLIKYKEYDHILMMAIVVALDALMAIPFAKLRYDKRPIRFATIKLAFIISNVLFNVFFLTICPWIYDFNPSLIDWFYSPNYGIGYIFVANLLSSLLVLVMLSPSFIGIKYRFDFRLMKKMLSYSFPLVILGIAGMISHVVVPLIYPYLPFESLEEAQYQIGIYTTCIKITFVISMFLQAFRFAYEPFIFAQNKEKDERQIYSQAMKYFVIFSFVLFLATIYYLDIIKRLITPNYYIGLSIVPIAMVGEICFGIYFNLSIWYKLTDRTQYGAYLSILGCIITVLINILFVPIYGFIASAWAVLISNLIIMLISYLLGQKYFPVNYQIKIIAFYAVLTTILYVLGTYLPIDNLYLRLSYRTVLLMLFIAIIIKKDIPLSAIPIINRYIK